MKFCAKCGNEINDDAVVCMKCGCKIESAQSSKSETSTKSQKPIYKKWWFWVIIVLALAVIGSAMGESEDGGDVTTTTTTSSIFTPTTTTNTPTTTTTTNAPATTTTTSTTTTTTSNSKEENIYYLGDTLSNAGLSITYQRCEEWTEYSQYFAPKDGYRVIRVYFVIENTSNSDKSTGYWDFDCYADGLSVENYFYADDQELDAYLTISAGRKMQGYIYYEIPVNAESVEIEYDISSIWNSKKAIFVVELD